MSQPFLSVIGTPCYVIGDFVTMSGLGSAVLHYTLVAKQPPTNHTGCYSFCLQQSPWYKNVLLWLTSSSDSIQDIEKFVLFLGETGTRTPKQIRNHMVASAVCPSNSS